MSANSFDTFICGVCGLYFHDLTQFVQHKNENSCSAGRSITPVEELEAHAYASGELGGEDGPTPVEESIQGEGLENGTGPITNQEHIGEECPEGERGGYEIINEEDKANIQVQILESMESDECNSMEAKLIQVCIDGTNIRHLAHFDPSTGLYYIIEDYTGVDLINECENAEQDQKQSSRSGLEDMDTSYSVPLQGGPISGQGSADSVQTGQDGLLSATTCNQKLTDIELVPMMGDPIEEPFEGWPGSGELQIVVRSSRQLRPVTRSVTSTEPNDIISSVVAVNKSEPTDKPAPRRRGRPRLSEAKVPKITLPTPNCPVKHKKATPERQVPDIGPNGQMSCPRCHKSFTRARHYTSHRCLAEGDYVDPTNWAMVKKEIISDDEDGDRLDPDYEGRCSNGNENEEEEEAEIISENWQDAGISTAEPVSSLLDCANLRQRYISSARKVLIINRRDETKPFAVTTDTTLPTDSQSTDDITMRLRVIQDALAAETEALRRVLDLDGDIESNVTDVFVSELCDGSKNYDKKCGRLSQVKVCQEEQNINEDFDAVDDTEEISTNQSGMVESRDATRGSASFDTIEEINSKRLEHMRQSSLGKSVLRKNKNLSNAQTVRLKNVIASEEVSAHRGAPNSRRIADRNAFDRNLDIDLAPLVDHMFTSHEIAQNENEHAIRQMTRGGGVRKSKPLTVYTCNTCEKVFLSQSHIRLHCVTHTNTRPFKCHRCAFSSNTKGNLYTHMRRHTGSLYRCSVCPFKTANRTHLVDHELTHVGERQMCELCRNTYNTPKSLLNHVRMHHTDETGREYFLALKGPSKRKNVAILHQCQICNRKFKDKEKRDKHILIHTHFVEMSPVTSSTNDAGDPHPLLDTKTYYNSDMNSLTNCQQQLSEPPYLFVKDMPIVV